MTIRYGAHCTVCPDPPPFDTVTDRDRWVTGHPHVALTSTEYLPTTATGRKVSP